MDNRLDRRQLLARSLGFAAMLTGITESCRQGADPRSARTDRSARAPSAPVAIQRCLSYEPQDIRSSLNAALDLIGGLKGLVEGKTVTVKLNATGVGGQCCGLPAERTYQTHPGFTAALCAALSDAGAHRIVLAESFYFRNSCEEALGAIGYDVKGIKAAGAHRVVFKNTRNRDSWPSYLRLKVPDGGLLFPAFDLHQCYGKTDVFISLAKLKQHVEAGITCSVKNLFGITPQALYGDGAPDEDSIRSRVQILHAGRVPVPSGVPVEHDLTVPDNRRVSTYRVPRIVADLCKARPIDLAIVEGVETIVGGDGPWRRNVHPVQPGIILAGRNPICTDAVCTAVMGYDATAAHCEPPFPGENHLRLLSEAGVGTNDVDQIEVVGMSLRDAAYRFELTA